MLDQQHATGELPPTAASARGAAHVALLGNDARPMRCSTCWTRRHRAYRARRRRVGSSEVGPNALVSHGARPLRILLNQFHNPLLILLIGTAVVSAFVGEKTDAIIILTIIGMSVGLGFVNEYRSARSVEELHSQLRHKALTLRDGKPVSVDVTTLVPGDVVQLSVGDVVPADLRLLRADSLQCDESVLTGESLPVEKQAEPCATPESPLALPSCAFMGTVVQEGSGQAVVVKTGAGTEFGAIAGRLGEAQPQTGFQAGLRDYSKMLVTVTRDHGRRNPGGQPAHRPLSDRIGPVCPVDRRGTDAAAAPGDRHGEPLHRRPSAGQAQGGGKAAGRDRGSRRHRCLLHGQDGHTHRRSDHVSRRRWTRRGNPRALCCATAWCATRP